MKRPLISALLLLPLAACFYPAERGKMLEERLGRLEYDNRQLEAALLEQKQRLEAQIPKLDEQVRLAQQALETLDKAARRTDADIGVQVQQLQGDLASLRGTLEESAFRLSEVQTALAELKGAAPAPAGPSGSVAPPPASPSPGGGTAAPQPARPVEKPSDKKAFAELVIKKLADSPEEGRNLAGEWLRKYPTDSLAARIHYELGASHFNQKNCRSALAEFGALIKPDAPKSFSRSEWAPEALLKSSDCFETLKMREEARLALEEILNSYPKSPAAKTARSKLEKTKKKPKGRRR